MIEQIKRIFIDILPSYIIKEYLMEEILDPNDTIMSGNKYKDHIETRKSINTHLKGLATRIRNLPYIKSCNPDPSRSKGKGLSNYIEVQFNYPDGLTKDEIDKNYKYTIRFSDHEDTHKDSRTHKTSYVDVVGRKVKNLEKAGIREFKTSLVDIQNKIKDFEIGKFGEQKTFINRTDECKLRIRELTINENLEEIAPSTYCTDSAKDIANWIVNKPKPYRILYDVKYDIWCIADAMSQTHRDMSIDMFDTDTKYLYGYARDLDNDIIKMRQIGNYSSGWTDAEVYSDFQFEHRNLVGMIFIPNNMNYRDYEESGFYENQTRLTTGTMFTLFPFNSTGVFKDLYRKLFYMNAIPVSLKQLFKNCYKEMGSDCLDKFYQDAEAMGYSESEIQDFLNSPEMADVVI